MSKLMCFFNDDVQIIPWLNSIELYKLRNFKIKTWQKLFVSFIFLRILPTYENMKAMWWIECVLWYDYRAKHFSPD